MTPIATQSHQLPVLQRTRARAFREFLPHCKWCYFRLRSAGPFRLVVCACLSWTTARTSGQVSRGRGFVISVRYPNGICAISRRTSPVYPPYVRTISVRIRAHAYIRRTSVRRHRRVYGICTISSRTSPVHPAYGMHGSLPSTGKLVNFSKIQVN